MNSVHQRIRRVYIQSGGARYLKLFAGLLILWGILLLIYRFILWQFNLGTPKWFPISILIERGITEFGILYLLFFLFLLSLLLWKIRSLNEWVLLIGCCMLIVCGNLMQGDFDAAFLKPFYATNTQYYADAVNVANWRDWLAAFNANQSSLALHSQTHPPFAVLIHNLFFGNSNFRLQNVAIDFSIVTLCTLPVLLFILRTLDIDSYARKCILLLFSVLPAVNIYSIVSLDGLIMTSSTIFLLGIILLLRKPKFAIIGFLLTASGFIITNYLTFGGIFLLGVGLILAALEYFSTKRLVTLKGLLACVVIFIGSAVILLTVFHYNHIESFLTASRIENPNGFRLFSDPAGYFLTRFEDVSEIAFFLSFGTLTILFTGQIISLKKDDFLAINNNAIALTGLLVLCLFFISGAYRTGETARSGLFIYPYFMILITAVDKETYPGLIILAGAQTAVMQIFMNFYW